MMRRRESYWSSNIIICVCGVAFSCLALVCDITRPPMTSACVINSNFSVSGEILRSGNIPVISIN